jgi:hypothetical protein
MIQEANTKSILLVQSTIVTNGATASAAFDCRGFDFAQVQVFKSLTTAATSLKIEQSDDATTYVTANLTSGTDFTIATNGTAASSTIPYYSFNIDTRGLRRYLKLTLVPADTNAVVATATLGRRANGTVVAGAATTVDTRNFVSV